MFADLSAPRAEIAAKIVPLAPRPSQFAVELASHLGQPIACVESRLETEPGPTSFRASLSTVHLGLSLHRPEKATTPQPPAVAAAFNFHLTSGFGHRACR